MRRGALPAAPGLCPSAGAAGVWAGEGRCLPACSAESVCRRPAVRLALGQKAPECAEGQAQKQLLGVAAGRPQSHQGQEGPQGGAGAGVGAGGRIGGLETGR